jgi:uncharacterized membrane protein
MNILLRCIAIAPFALLGALPAIAGSPSAPRPAAYIEMAEANISTNEHSAYVQKAQAELQAWKVKLDDFGARAKDKSKQARKAAADELNASWAKAREASAKLESAGQADWDSAKASYKTATDELAATWTKVRAELK